MTHPLADFPKIQHWSERVTSVLGLNPNLFTGPGTNTFLIGTGRRRILLDTGQAVEGYLDLLESALEELGCEIECILATHAHPDHVGGIGELRARFGSIPVLKWSGSGELCALEGAVEHVEDGQRIEVEGATLRALHTPGHAADHLCFELVEEQAIFTGDNVLGQGMGTTVILMQGGDLGAYLASLERLLTAAPARLYPGHGGRIDDAVDAVRFILDHRALRDRQILRELETGASSIAELVERIYTHIPEALHPAAAQSVGSHLLALERGARVRRLDPEVEPLTAEWRLC